MSTAAVPAVAQPIQQSLVALRAGQESFARYVLDLFQDLEAMREQLLAEERRLRQQRDLLAEERRELDQRQRQQLDRPQEPDPALQAKMAELEQDRLALEEELESVRTRAVGLAETIAEQKRQMAEEHAEWSAELRQLRRILDKQATWIAQQTESGTVPWSATGHGHYPSAPMVHPHSPAPVSHAVPIAAAAPPAGPGDPVLGSVLSQFELLQRDVARRREARTG